MKICLIYYYMLFTELKIVRLFVGLIEKTSLSESALNLQMLTLSDTIIEVLYVPLIKKISLRICDIRTLKYK